MAGAKIQGLPRAPSHLSDLYGQPRGQWDTVGGGGGWNVSLFLNVYLIIQMFISPAGTPSNK